MLGTAGTDRSHVTEALALALGHDLANYLTAILNLCAAARTELPTGIARELFDEVREIAEAAAQLTAQARALRPGAPEETVDLREVVQASLGMLRRMTGGEVTIVPVFADTACRVRVTRSRVEQVLVNLILNARDARPADGRVTVAVRCDSARVVLEVADRGGGMTEEVREQAAEPFFTTKAGRGTGLGLAIVRMVARDAQGDFEIESEPGSGTRVLLTFPLAPTAAPH